MQKTVEFDSEKLQEALSRGLDLNDCAPGDIEGLLAREKDELEDQLSSDESSIDLAALGADYDIGPLQAQLVLGNLFLLFEIGSPFAKGLEQDQTLTFDEVAQAVYVLCLGREVLRPLMLISQRISDLALLRPLCKGNPEMMQKVLDKAEEISEGRVRFAEEARVFYETNFAGCSLDEVVAAIMNMVIDGFKVIGDNPIDPSGGKKN